MSAVAAQPSINDVTIHINYSTHFDMPYLVYLGIFRMVPTDETQIALSFDTCASSQSPKPQITSVSIASTLLLVSLFDETV